MTSGTVACQAPLSVQEISSQEYWSGLLFPSPEDLPNTEVEPWYPALQADSLPTELQEKPQYIVGTQKVFMELVKIKTKKNAIYVHIRGTGNLHALDCQSQTI